MINSMYKENETGEAECSVMVHGADMGPGVSTMPMQTSIMMAAPVDPFGGQQVLLATQVFEVMELCGIEAKNRYRISPPENPVGGTFLFAQESSEACQRICCSPCRSFTMNVHQGESKQGPVVLSLEKTEQHCPMLPWPVFLHPGAWFITCPWVCIAFTMSPPQITVKRAGTVVGTITDPPGQLFCCKANFIIRDASGNEIFEVGPHTLCQFGQCCPCLADEVVKVHDARSGAEVARISRLKMTCLEICQKTNRFTVDFGQVQDPNHKALIFAAGLFFDMQYWEVKNQ